jgi:hypothetical protein
MRVLKYLKLLNEGSSLQSSNTEAFRKADLSISINEMPGTLDGEPLPRVGSCFINTHHCSILDLFG